MGQPPSLDPAPGPVPIAAEWPRLLADPAVPGEALLAWAARPDIDPLALEVLARHRGRLVETPAIAAAIFLNPRAPLSVANQAIATCHRARVVPDGLIGFDELARSIDADPQALQPAAVDSGFDHLLRAADVSLDPGDDPAEAETEAETEAASSPSGAPASVDGAAAPPARSAARRSATIDFSRLKLYEKIRLATLGNAYCRQHLLRDSNRMVAMAVIRSPQITDAEIAKAAANRAVSEDVIRYIGNRKELVKQYPVKLALVGNPKCPLAVALRLLPTLHADDIKQLARSKNVPAALSVAAKRLAAARGPQ